MGFPLSDLLVPTKQDKAKLYGTKPVYGTPEKAAAESIAANLANLPASEALASKVNAFNQAELMAMLRKVIPGFDKKIALQSDLLESGLRGEVPADVAKQLQLRAASKSVAGGYGGSGMARNLEARDFGLTSFDITNKALDSTSRWTESMARLTQPAMFNVGSAFITPQQQFDFNKLVSETKAAPSPGERGAFDSKMATLGMMLGVYGGAGYQGSYSPGPQPTKPTGSTDYVPQWGGKYGETAVGAGAFDY